MQPTEPDLHALALRAAGGDWEAFQQIRAACYGTIASYVRYKLRGSPAADAVITEVFQTAWQRIGSYETYPGLPSTAASKSVLVAHWLALLARDAVMCQYRRDVSQQ